MSSSDSEDSFHSAEDAEEDIRQRDADIQEEERARESTHVAVPATTTVTRVSDVPPTKTTAESMSWSDTLESDLDLDGLLAAEHAALLEKRGEIESKRRDTSPPEISQSDRLKSQIPWPLNAEQEDPVEMDDSYVRQNSLSLPDSPSEPSTDKESGSEMKEWDRLSGNGADEGEEGEEEKSRQETSAVVDQSLLDEWEKGWDDTDVTEDDIAAVCGTSGPSGPSGTLGTLGPSTASQVPTHDSRKSDRSTTALVKEPVQPVQSVQSVQPAKVSVKEKEATTLPSPNAPPGGLWGKWGGWGTNLLSTAVGQVGQGLSVVMDTVEQSLGAPKPEELAALDVHEDNTPSSLKKEGESARSPAAEPAESVTGWLSDLTTKVQSGGLSLVTNSLDVLEGLGKKTMEVVNDKDPGLRQTKAVLTGKINQPILSQVLREAKTTRFDTRDRDRSSGKREEQTSFVHYFDEEQGTGSWEALELLSTQCAQRLQTRENIDKAETKQETLEDLEELCQGGEAGQGGETGQGGQGGEEDTSTALRLEYGRLNLGLPEPHALLHVYRTAEDFLKDNSKAPETDVELWIRNVHRNGVRTFAACTAKSLEQTRKMAEMIFLSSTKGKEDENFLRNRVQTVNAIVCLFCLQVEKLANRYAACLALSGSSDVLSVDKKQQKTSASSQITDLFVEASNSNRYIQDGFGLCLPIFKLALLNETA